MKTTTTAKKARSCTMDLVILSIDGRTTDVLCGPMKRWGHVTL